MYPFYYEKRWYVSLFISLGIIIGLRVLQRHFLKLKLLTRVSVISFFVVFICLTVLDFAHWPNYTTIGEFLCIIVFAPGCAIGLMIAFLFGTGLRAANCDEWKIVMYVSSFIFYTLLLFGILKGILYLKGRLSKRKPVQNGTPAKPE